MAPETAGALAIDRCHQGIISFMHLRNGDPPVRIRGSQTLDPRSFPVCPTFSRCYGRNLESILNVDEHVLLIQHI